LSPSSFRSALRSYDLKKGRRRRGNVLDNSDINSALLDFIVEQNRYDDDDEDDFSVLFNAKVSQSCESLRRLDRQHRAEFQSFEKMEEGKDRDDQ
ncbi:hypothetical protein V1477_007659, partial [Vespula maculifrons]